MMETWALGPDEGEKPDDLQGSLHGALCLPHAHWNPGWPLLAGANSPELRTVQRGMGELGHTTLQGVWPQPRARGCVGRHVKDINGPEHLRTHQKTTCPASLYYWSWLSITHPPAPLLGEMAALVWTGPQRLAHPRQGPSPSARDWRWRED